MKPAASSSILAAALIVALVPLSPVRALADELPKDTNQIERLTPEQATVLAGSTAWDGQLRNLTTLDAATAKALAEFKGHSLYLDGLTTLDAATAKVLAEYKGGRLELNGLTTLDAARATALAEFKGQVLSLDGLTTLDADIAKALAEFKGQLLLLNGLITLDADIAAALAEFKGKLLCLNRLTTLDAATAKALAGSPAWNGDLSSITAFESPDSVETAAALANRKGPISLRNLTKISPKALTALIEKEDVDIPLIETLELIQEPDGSPTEDFMIPKGFQSRQKMRQQGR